MFAINKAFIFAGYLLIVSCAGSGIPVSENSRAVNGSTKNITSIIWEPSPSSVADGNDGQLIVRASESINMLYAVHDNQGKQDLFMSKTKNIGDSFSGRVRVNSEKGEVSAHGENGPKLKQGKGRGIFAAWVGNRDIKFSRSMNFGKSFSPAIRVNDDDGKASQSFFTMEVAPDGTVYIAWLDGRHKKSGKRGTSSIYLARSFDQGKTFGKNIKIAADICPCCRPALAFGNNGEIFASWRHVYPDNERIIVVATSRDGGETWSDPVKTIETGWKINGCAHSGPAMKYLGEKLLITWYTGRNEKASLKFAFSYDKGQSFQIAEDLNGSILDANHPDIAVVGNEAWVIFQGRDPTENEGWGREGAWLVRINEEGKASDPVPLPSTGGSVAYPYLFPGNGGRVYATWTEIGDKGSNVVLCRGRIN